MNVDKAKGFLAKAGFLMAFVLAFALVDFGLARACPKVFMDGGYTLNDYEITVRDHGGSTSFGKAIFGSSNVISDYREDASTSGYANMGIAYGVISDLKSMLEGGYIDIESELVVGVSYLSFYDEFDTNPNYPWHRLPLEPYCYFERDRLSQMVRTTAGNFVGLDFTPEAITDEKFTVVGKMTPEELDAAVARHEELYWRLPSEKFEKNLQALQDVADWCTENNVRLRAVWMPWNPDVRHPQIAQVVENAANEVFSRNGIEVLDLSDEFGAECFYDVGHLSHDFGAYRFVEVIDPWLNS